MGVQSPHGTCYIGSMASTTFRLTGRTHYAKHRLDGHWAEHTLSFTPDDATGTVTLDSEVDGHHAYTKEVTRETARDLWRRLSQQGYRRLG